MFLAFPNCLYVQTSKTVLQPVESFIHWMQRPDVTDKMIEDAGCDPALRYSLKLPNKVTIPKYVPGTNEPLDPRPTLDKIINTYLAASMAGTNPYEGLVFDEWTEFAHRIQMAIDLDSSYGKDGFKRIKSLKECHYHLAEVPRATNTVLGLICHELEPVFDMKEGTPTYGQLKYRGGPKMPIKPLTHEVSAAMDVVLRIVIESGSALGDGYVKRQYVTEIQKEWTCKIRTWGMKPREPLGLRSLLTRGGYRLK